jgi:predicted nucleic acid-binding Zn ribbon protein
MPAKTSRSAKRRPRRRINWQRLLFMLLGLLVVLAFILSMIKTG